MTHKKKSSPEKTILFLLAYSELKKLEHLGT